MHVESGAARHTVDFDDHTIRTGDVLWVRAGPGPPVGRDRRARGHRGDVRPAQHHQRARDLIRSDLVRPQSHWPAADLAGTPIPNAFALLIVSPRREAGPNDLHQAALTHSLAALLVQLVQRGQRWRARRTTPTHEAYAWFRDHIEEHFRRWHKVSEYAERLGYSTPTLNRLARQNTGLSAKELIDERVVLEAKRQSVMPAPGGRDHLRSLASTTRRTSPPTSSDRSAQRPAPSEPRVGQVADRYRTPGPARDPWGASFRVTGQPRRAERASVGGPGAWPWWRRAVSGLLSDRQATLCSTPSDEVVH